MSSFRARSRSEAGWFLAGLSTSFPDLGTDEGNLSELRFCGADLKPGCKVFRVPKSDSSRSAAEVLMAPDVLDYAEIEGGLKEQVLVFKYRGKFHAVDHKCPHSSYPLSHGTPFDIEDFGVVLSAGLTCPKHGWSFDLFSGMADRARYKLGVWEVQLREVAETETPAPSGEPGGVTESSEKEVWVRRKQRIG
ncbi:Rieske domain-containing protein [Colletotrichum falcatum]|nr:Rieske domain-containing protein [Colletotrichum falcatum]